MQSVQNDKFWMGSREVECFLEHFSLDQIDKFNDHYIGSYDNDLDLLHDLLSEIENNQELISLVKPYLNYKGVLQEIALRDGLIIHEDLDYIVFRT
ncbi:MAG: hypothetical protein COB02_14325 [Candidatus Cloacimonadota bacterium]|nr:MAG: hypothetical protein COB02_14325 [Candidatus Cloacimonadota bacterium]